MCVRSCVRVWITECLRGCIVKRVEPVLLRELRCTRNLYNITTTTTTTTTTAAAAAAVVTTTTTAATTTTTIAAAAAVAATTTTAAAAAAATTTTINPTSQRMGRLVAVVWS